MIEDYTNAEEYGTNSPGIKKSKKKDLIELSSNFQN